MRDYSVLFRGKLAQSVAKLLALALATALTLTIAGSVNVSRAYAADALGDQQVQQVGQQVLANLQQVDFRDKAIRDKLAKTNFTAAEKLNKKVAIWKDNKDKYPTLNDVPDEVVLQALQEEYLLASDMEGAFNQIKKDLPTILPLMIKADSQVAAAGKNKDVAYYVDAIKNDTAGFLIGAAYLQRNYGFNIKEGATVARQLMTENNAFGKEYAPMDVVKAIGQQSADQRKMLSTPKLFKEVLGGKIADQTDLGAFLNDQVTKAGQKPADWFWKTSKAVIFEKKSKANPTAPYRVFDKLKGEPNGQAELLALLNVSENSLYVASTVESIMYGLTDTYVNRALKDADPDAYHAELEAFENKVEYAAERQADYLDFWYRLAKEDKRVQLVGNRRVWDNQQIKNPNENSAAKRWSPKQGVGVASGVNEFMTPLGYYFTFTQADGVADINSGQIHYWLANGLDDRGLTTYAHEHTHQMANQVHFAGYGQRSGASAELITRGVFEPWHKNDDTDKGVNFDLNQIFDRSDQNPYGNKTPDRFQTADDLKTYYGNQMDLIYTLDYLEAEVALSKDDATKAKLFNKATLSGRDEKFDNITVAEAKNLKTINDLVDMNAVAYRFMVEGQKVTGTAKYNGYYAIPLFTPIYGAPHNPNGMSGDIHTKRLSWEMLAAYGYYEGMVPYLSNQLKPGNVAQNTQFSDDVIISKVSGGTYPTMAAFKKAQYAERIAKKDTLKPITINWEGKTQQITTYAQLKELMDAAVEDDLKNNRLLPSGWYSKLPTKTKVEQLKSAIFLAYKTNTNEFATNIYKDAPKTYTVSYNFKDFDALPEDVQKLLPTPQTDIAAGSSVILAQPGKKQVITDKGIYDFKGWEPKTITNIAKDETVTGTWTFTAYVTPKAPSSLDEDFTEGGNEYIGSYTLPEVEGVEYLVDGKVVTGKVNVSPNQADVNAPVTVTVTARAKDGYSLKPSATSSWEFRFTRVSDKERYEPFADPISLTVGDTLPLPKDVVKFPDTPGQMPIDLDKVKFAWKAPTPSTDTVGKIKGIITVTYADGSSEDITVKVIVKADEHPGTDPTEPGTKPGGDMPGTTPNPDTGKPETKPAGEGASSPKPGQSAPATAGKKPALSNTGSVGLTALALLASLSTAGALLLIRRRKSAEKR
ncbi:MAG: hypothetical protein KH242_02285 [Varibaculum cambriense]|uniref:ZmpA/ZmpB/ZmpC family metallo-endopeptidase n=1 Tax=Varibaculum cambriense TaxID=184870 RepID=UPI00241D7754|nr:ZmpA/ZmpB/ZmpC family metallo-endopeptidase [Varibaculum cambriense]MBS6753372.1 hypothetical protein [Varibaculum cambriense]